MRLDDFLRLLDGVRHSGSGGTAKCPGHDDGHASLSVGEGEDGRILLKCFAGCTAEQIAAALDLTLADLMPPRKRSPSRRQTAAYPYSDESGALLFEVVRLDPKEFRQRRPDGRGGWIWNLDSVRRVLYRLPELMTAEPTRFVFLPEGEKDVDRLLHLGLIATTNPGGAGKWRPDFSEHLQGRDVAILPDNDGPGRSHAEVVARSLHEVGASVRVLNLPNLPPKGDTSNWLDAGGTAEELERLAGEAPEWTPPTVPPVSVLLGDLVALVRRFVVLTEAQAVAWALWVAHTHALDATAQTPYLSITSPERRSGKTRVLEISELVVARPWLTGRVSAAVLVRKVDKMRPTLLLDESDAAFNSEKEYAEALRGILNTGHRANGKASLCVGQGAALDFRDFSTFCPKAIAGIGKLPDTVADRAIPIRLQRKAKSERVERFREKTAQTKAAPLRDHLESWAAANMETLRLAEPTLPDELSDRQQDGSEPLLAIADLAGGDWPERSRRALVELFGGDTLEDDSLGVQLLRDCRAVFEAHDVDRLSSSGLCAELVTLAEAPWSEFQKGKPLTLRGLARLLHPFRIGSRSIRLDDGTTPKGYHRASFEEAWSRYLPATGFSNATPPQLNTAAGFLDFSIRHTDKLVADEKREIVNTDGPCGGVADKSPLTGRGARPCGYHVGEAANPCDRCRLSFREHLRASHTSEQAEEGRAR